MNRTIIERSLAYFDSTEPCGATSKYFKCKICGEIKSGTQKSNLTTHIQRRHHEIYKKKIFKVPGVEATVQQLITLQNLTELIAVDLLPFHFVLKGGFQKIISEKVEKLGNAGVPINVTDPHLRQLRKHMRETAIKIKRKIIEEVGKRLFAMSCDIVSKHGRSILGIIIQYIFQGISKTRLIGMLQLKERHTGKYLSQVIKGCLSEFGWESNRVIALTSDNASNMKTMVKHLNPTDGYTADEATRLVYWINLCR